MIRSHGRECHFVRVQSGDIRRCRPIRADTHIDASAYCGDGCEGAPDSTNQSSPPRLQCAVGYKRHCYFISPIPFNYAVQKRRRLVRESYYAVRSLAKTRPLPVVVETEVTISRGAIRGHSTVAPPSGKIQPIRAFLPTRNARS